jgi:uncharacterized protein YjdB
MLFIKIKTPVLMKSSIYGLGTLLLVMSFITNGQSQLYVDPINGSDSFNGSLSTPFQTITKAQSSVRSYLATLTNMTNDFYIYLKGGTYSLNTTLNFSALDGGKDGFNVIYKAYNNEKPIISGGKKVSGWIQVPGEKYFVANVPTTGAISYPSYFRQIWVNGKRRQQAKSDFINVYPKPFDNVATTQVADGYIVKKAAIKNYTNLSDIRIFQDGEFKHVEQRLSSIGSISDSEQVLMMRNPAYDNWTKTYVYNNLNQIQVVNAFEELDEPGEFYLDRTSRKLYYYPQPAENLATAEVIVPATEYLVKFVGTAGNMVQNIQFEGIAFEHGNWTGPNLTTKEIGRSQADLYSDYTSIEGQMWMDYAQKITIKNCRFERLASSGIYLISNNNNINIEGNIFNDLTAAAVIIGFGNGGSVLLNTSVNRDILIKNNLIRNIGADFFQASGIYANASKNLTILHNDVADIAYFGINQRYGNSIADITSALAVANTGNTLIQYNKVTNFGTAAKLGFGIGDEVAGIYFFGVRSSKVQYNYVQYGGKDERLKGALRQDQYGSGNYWEYNVADCKPAARSFSWFDPLNTHTDTLVFANCYANVPGLFQPTAHGDTVNFFYEPNAPSWSADAQSIINNAGLEPAYQYLLSEFGDGTNIAKNATITSSSNFSSTFKASNLTDQKIATNWKPIVGSETNGSWIQLSFPQPIAINKIQLIPEYKNVNPSIRQLFEVRVSNDPNFASYNILGAQFAKPFPYKITFLDKDVPIAYNTIDLLGCDTLGYRYIRIFGRFMSWAECRVYGRNQAILPSNYTSSSSVSLVPYTPLPTPIESESWSQKVADTVDHARVYFGSDVKYWNQSGGMKTGTVTVAGGIASLTGGTFTFKGSIYRNERTCFNIKITENRPTTTHYIAARASYVLQGIYNQDNYLLSIKKQATGAFNTNIQLQRRNRDGTISTFYGTNGSLGTAKLVNTTLFSAFTPVVIDFKSTVTGISILVKIGTDTIFNMIDNSAKRIVTPGYLVFVPGNTNGIMQISDIPVTGIQLQPNDTSININQTVQLNPIVLPDNATIANVKYVSSNPSVAAVNSVGMITGLALGTATITATTKDGAFVATLLVHVQQPLAFSDVALSTSFADNQVILKWRIMGDALVKDCEIQQMGTDGSFNLIGKVNGINPAPPLYSFIPPSTTTGKQYYRIKVSFLDGSVIYSHSTMVDIPVKLMKMTVSPNPINHHQLAIHFEQVPSGWYFLKVHNVAGALIFQKHFFHSGNMQLHQFALPNTVIKSQMLNVSLYEKNAGMPVLQQKIVVEN